MDALVRMKTNILAVYEAEFEKRYAALDAAGVKDWELLNGAHLAAAAKVYRAGYADAVEDNTNATTPA